MELQEVAIAIPGLAAAIGVIIEVLKRTKLLPSKYAAATALLIGLFVGVLYAAEAGESFVISAIGGLVAAATASGIYSGTKSLVEDKDPLSHLDR